MSEHNNREQGSGFENSMKGFGTGQFIELKPLATYESTDKKIEKPQEPLYPNGEQIPKPTGGLGNIDAVPKQEQLQKQIETNREEDLEKAKYRLELAQSKSQIEGIIKEFNEPVSEELNTIGRGVNLERFGIVSVKEGEFVIMKNTTFGKNGKLEELDFWELPSYKAGDKVKVERNTSAIIEEGWTITEIHDIGPNQPRREMTVVKIENGVASKKRVSAKKLYETNL